MSYILDALKKSEQQHDVISILTPSQGRGALSAYVQRYARPLAVGLAIVAVLVALGLWSYMKSPDSAADPRPAKDGVANIAVEPEQAPPPKPDKSEPAKAAKPLPPVETPVVRPPVGNLAEQARVRSSKTRSKKVAKTRKKRHAAKKKVASTKAPAVTAPVSASSKPSRDANQEQIEWGSVPFLRQMPDDFRDKIPDMVLNVHLYSADESENLVYIDNRQYRRGERIKNRIRLEQIVQEGVVLNYNGVLFKLPRPN